MDDQLRYKHPVTGDIWVIDRRTGRVVEVVPFEDQDMRLRDTRTPECVCPWCGHLIDAALAANPNMPNATPYPGAVCVCIGCAQILRFQDDLTVRATMPGEVEMSPALALAIEAVKRTLGYNS